MKDFHKLYFNCNFAGTSNNNNNNNNNDLLVIYPQSGFEWQHLHIPIF
jgi:hypothetical protein